jgi:hypothetical protein
LQRLPEIQQMVRSLSVENDALRKVNISSFKRMKNPATCLILGYVRDFVADFLGCFCVSRR